MSKQIVLIELKNTNLGDSIISDTCEHIIKQVDNDCNITRLNILPPHNH